MNAFNKFARTLTFTFGLLTASIAPAFADDSASTPAAQAGAVSAGNEDATELAKKPKKAAPAAPAAPASCDGYSCADGTKCVMVGNVAPACMPDTSGLAGISK